MSLLPAPSNLETHLGYWLRFVSNHVSGAFREQVEAHGVTLAEWVALRSLCLLGMASLRDLAAHMGDDTGAASRLAERLVNKGFVRRAASRTDRRSIELALTSPGQALVVKIAKDSERIEARFFGPLCDADQAHLRRILRVLIEAHGMTAQPLE